MADSPFPLRAHWLGKFDTDASALAYIQSMHWDAGKGDNNPWPGMFYKNLTSGDYRIWNGTEWEDMAGYAGLVYYYVNPDDPDDAYETINDAYAALDSELPATEAGLIILAPFKTHQLTGDLTLNPNRNVIIRGQSTNYSLMTWTETTVEGNFILPDASGAPSRTIFRLEHLLLDGNITATDNWEISGFNVDIYDTLLTRNHGANDVSCYFEKCWLSSTFFVVDNDAPTAPTSGIIHVKGGELDFLGMAANQFTFAGDMLVILQECALSLVAVAGGAVFDFNGDSSTLTMVNVNIQTSNFGANPELFTGVANLDVNWNETTIVPQTGSALNMEGTAVTHAGSPYYRSTNADGPIDPATHMEWHDLDLDDKMVWDGTYWTLNGMYRQDVLVDIGGAAANHDIGWNVPAAAYVIRYMWKLLKDLTGAGGAVQCGLGITVGPDPDKYGETANLLTDQEVDSMHATWADGGSDDLQIYAETAPGVAGGTIAGSGDEDARVIVYFMMPNTVP